MFGYVTVYKPELKVKEYEAYKGVYCTLCREMGREYGVLSRFLLSYDGAFFVIFKLGISGESVTARNTRCTFNPCKKCVNVSCSGNAYRLAGAITVILAYYKLIDNITDGGVFKKVIFTLIRPYFSFLKKRAEKKYPDIVREIDNGIKKQFSAEKAENITPDSAADASAQMLSAIFSYGEADEKAEFAKKFGYLLGRTVYFLDAFDDYEDDLKSGSFNPFKDSKNLIEDAELSVNLSVGELVNLTKTQSFNKFDSIVDNIICDGLSFQLSKISKKYRGDDFEQSI